MLDISVSHFVSLPSMISDEDCDTQIPSNIFDDEFGPDIKVLPPSRPKSEPTPISYMITKIKICIGLNKVLKVTGNVGKPVSYDEILQLDAYIRELKEEMPDHIQFKPLNGCQEPINVILARVSMEIFNQKMICLLHRGFMARARTNMRYALSRRRAVGAALECLRHLCVIDHESQPNNRLAPLRWHVCYVATKDFFLPAMIIVDELYWHLQKRMATPEGRLPEFSSFWLQSEISEMITLLEKTREIWRGFSKRSIEAIKAYKIMGFMLDQIKLAANRLQSGVVTAQQFDSKNVSMQDYAPQEMAPEQSAAMTLGMLSTGVSSGSTAIMASSNTAYIPDSGGGIFEGPSSNSNHVSTTAASGNGSGSANLFSFGSNNDEFISDANPLTMGDFGMNDFAGLGGPSRSAMTPTTMFNNFAETMDLNTEFDWVYPAFPHSLQLLSYYCLVLFFSILKLKKLSAQ